MDWDLDGYFNLMASVQKRRGKKKTHQEIQALVKTNKRFSKPAAEITKKGQQLKLF